MEDKTYIVPVRNVITGTVTHHMVDAPDKGTAHGIVWLEQRAKGLICDVLIDRVAIAEV